MSKCIQLACSCTGYKEPAQSKSTLLQFRLSCQECGHQASEHRKLTAVDQYIKSQVATRKRSRCSTLIPPSEIPLSPVFSTYDLIPIPRDDCLPNTENSVQCTCRGFQIPDVIRLCQKFRTHSLNDVPAELDVIPCSFCTHPLSSHTTVKQDSAKEYSNALFANMKPSLGIYESLALKQSTSLPCPPLNHNCLELVMPLSSTDSFLILSVGKFKDSDTLRLAVTSHRVRLNVDNEPPSDVVSMESSTEDLSRLCTSQPRKRVRKKPPVSPPAKRSSVRSSVRLATKKFREEEKKILKSLKGLKGIGNHCEVDIAGSNVAEMSDVSELEQKQLSGGTVSFMEQLKVIENYQSFPLPQELLDVDAVLPLMAARRITNDSASHNALENACERVLVAMGTKGSPDVFLAVVQSLASPDGNSEVCQWQCRKCTGEGKLECLVLKEGLQADEVLVLVGRSSGCAQVLRVAVAQDRIEDTILLTSFYCTSQCLAVNCSVSTMFVAAGTMFGDVVLCGLPCGDEAVEQVQPAVQTIRCCKAPVRRITWSQDGRLVAIGACDDAIQVLQCGEPPATEQPASKGSILNYFKRSRSSRQPKFVHIYTLKGHTSFIADLHFTSSCFLISVGWDSQLLFWSGLTQRTNTHHHHQKRRSKLRGERAELEVELVDPVGGYKIGPALAVVFLPLLLRPVRGCGLLVVMANKLGGVTVANYFKYSL